MKRVIVAFLGWKVMILIGVYVATFVLPFYPKFSAALDFGLRLPYFIWIWGNFDGTHYLEIARNGYHFLEYPFFPLFPFLIKILFEIPDTFKIYLPFIISGIIISNIAFFLSLLVVLKLLDFDKNKVLKPLVLLVIVFFPTSFFFGAVYNDSLFFLFATLTILAARKRNFLGAGIFGSLATLTRLNGLALIFLIAFEYIGSHWDIKKLLSETKSKLELEEIMKSKIYTVLLIPLIFIGYLFYVQYLSGNWQDLFTAMKVWNQSEPTFPLQVAFRYMKIFLFVDKNTIVYWVAAFEFLSVLFYVAMLVFSFKKIRLSYWIFFAVSILIPSITGTFAGMPRYGLHIYPFFLSIALFLENKPLNFKAFYFAISLALFLFAITLFTRGYFVS